MWVDLMMVDTKSDLNVYKEGILSEEAVGVADAGASSSSCCKPAPAPKQSGAYSLLLGQLAMMLTMARLLWSRSRRDSQSVHGQCVPRETEDARSE